MVKAKKSTWQSTTWKVLLFLLLLGMLSAAINKPVEQTEQSKQTSFRNAAISGCKQEAVKYPTIDAEAYCGCAYDKLAEMYPDLYSDTGRQNRIIQQGFTPAETDAIAVCLQ